jgi:TonB family protein
VTDALKAPFVSQAAITAAAAVVVLAILFAVRRQCRAFLGPSAIGLGLFAFGMSCFLSVRQIINVFRGMSESGSGGVGALAAGLLETRYAVLFGAIAILVTAAFGLASLSLGSEPTATSVTPRSPASSTLLVFLFVFSSLALVLATVLMYWDGALTSWVLRIVGSDDETSSLATVSRNVGLSLSGLSILCFVAILGSVLLVAFSQAVASPASPPKWFVSGCRTLLALAILISVVSLTSGYRQRSWMYRTALTGSLPGVARKSPRQLHEFSTRPAFEPCTPHPGADAADTVRMSSELTEPVEVSRVKPEYPEDVRRARIQGVAILEAVISRDGIVQSVCILRSVDSRIDEAAARAVSQWKYRPATRRSTGEPVAVYLTVTVTFRLE